ncbi:hypothetical protein K7X08_027276 [Anisodus acutangulus]|uniref:Pectinesterase inhibitor domain-containing protein n=1 Tax=Anisodus acutangulus TaxID=402998 RepID=A0A9Q1MJ20_9SOLA|nr:hypothetical protein K7X08_027276 [Anisodus acutangulus]
MNLMGILVIIFLTSFSFVAHISYGDLIDDVCQKTDDNSLCVKSLRADPRSASADKKGLARIMVQLSQAKASDILNQTKVLLKQIKEPVLKQCLEVCRDNYDMAVFWYSDSIKYIDAGDFDDATSSTSGPMNDADTCDESFTEPPVRKADPRSASADKKGLARIMVQLSQAKASDILNQTKVLLKQIKEPVLKQCLEVCRDNYDMAVFWYSDSIKYIDAGDFDDATSSTSGPMNDL